MPTRSPYEPRFGGAFLLASGGEDATQRDQCLSDSRKLHQCPLFESDAFLRRQCLLSGVKRTFVASCERSREERCLPARLWWLAWGAHLTAAMRL